jgi:hypothetical protein
MDPIILPRAIGPSTTVGDLLERFDVFVVAREDVVALQRPAEG